MSRRYQVTPEAQTQIDAIGVFIAQDSVDAALRVLDSLEEAFEQLADMPDIGHTRADLTDKPVKFWAVFSYLVIYDPASDPVRIVAVVHGARDLGRILS